MSVECTLNVSGIKPEVSNKAVIRSFQQTSSPKYYQKYQKRIESYFQDKLQKNISQAQISNDIADTFNIKFQSDGIYFNSDSIEALKYEFGSKNTPPKRFIEPAFTETANEVSQLVITDAIDLYNRYTR